MMLQRENAGCAKNSHDGEGIPLSKPYTVPSSAPGPQPCSASSRLPCRSKTLPNRRLSRPRPSSVYSNVLRKKPLRFTTPRETAGMHVSSSPQSAKKKLGRVASFDQGLRQCKVFKYSFFFFLNIF